MINDATFRALESEVRSYCRSFPAVFAVAKAPMSRMRKAGSSSIFSQALVRSTMDTIIRILRKP